MLCLHCSGMDVLLALWLLVDGEGSVLETLIYMYHVMGQCVVVALAMHTLSSSLLCHWSCSLSHCQIVVAVVICRAVVAICQVVVVAVVVVIVLVFWWGCDCVICTLVVVVLANVGGFGIITW